MITLETIFCPIDLQPATDEALSYALALAKAYEAKLYVCYVAEGDEINSATEMEFRHQIASVVESHCYHTETGRLGLPDWEPLLATGEVASVIVREAAKHHADLIVMHSRRQSYAATLLGSTAESVCRNAPCPVLITHPYEHDCVNPQTGEIQLKNILLADDFSDDSAVALALALTLAEEYQAQLHLLHVIPHTVMEEFANDEEIERNLQLQEEIPAEAKLWCNLKTVVRRGKPYEEILRYADEHEIDLLCIGLRGAGLAAAEIGSNVEHALRQADCPVLVARPLKPASFVLAEQKVQLDAQPLFER